MKKIKLLSMILVIILALSVTACGKSKAPAGSEVVELPKYETELLSDWQNYTIVFVFRD